MRISDYLVLHICSLVIFFRKSLGYTSVEQIKDLEVRMLPRGSFTTLQDLQERKLQSGKMLTRMARKASKESSLSKVSESREVGGDEGRQDMHTSSGRVDSSSTGSSIKKAKRKHQNEAEGGDGEPSPSKVHHKKKVHREDNI